MIYGWVGKILHVNLTEEKITTEPTLQYAEKFIGGRGINIAILYKHIKPNTDPFDPANVLAFGTGPLTATTAPAASRVDVASKSPMTGLLGLSNFGGFFGAELKFAGYDHVVVHGKAAKPVYLWINDGNVEIRNASSFWGKDTFETMKLLRKELGNHEVKVASIGLGGERRIRFASIVHDLGDGAGRTGMGAVMGSKNLKAIAVRGTDGIKIFDSRKYIEICKAKFKKVVNGQFYNDYAYTEKSKQRYEDDYGDVYWAVLGNKEKVTWDKWTPDSDARQEIFVKKFGLRAKACFNCPIGCMVFANLAGVGACLNSCQGFLEPVWGLKIPDQKFAFEYVKRCETLGIDILTSVHLLAWLSELCERGIVSKEQLDGIVFESGDRQAIMALFDKIVARDGVGELLAEGPLRALQGLDLPRKKEAEKLIMHTKGQTHYGLDNRSYKGCALATAVGPRGDMIRAHPNIEWVAEYLPPDERDAYYEFAMRVTGYKEAAMRTKYEGKPAAVIWQEHEHTVVDMMGICKWTTSWLGFPLTSEDLTELFVPCTGRNLTQPEILKMAERVRNLERAFEAREGLSRKDETLPERYFEEPLPDGPFAGEKIDRERFEKMKDEYYMLKGWSVSTGLPTRRKLEELGLADVADDLEALGKLCSK